MLIKARKQGIMESLCQIQRRAILDGQKRAESGFKVKLNVCFAHMLVHYYTEIRAHHPNSLSALPSVMLWHVS